jgi:hypothetical protein
MGVQQRIALAAGAVVEANRQQPFTLDVLVAAVAAPRPQVLVQVGGRLADAGVMRLQDGPAGGWVAEAVEDRDALGRPQDHVEGRHRALAVGAAEKPLGVGVAALEHALEPRRRCFALQPEGGGAGAVPPSWGLAVAGQVLLVVGGQLAEVVVLAADRELGHIRHHLPLPPRLRWRERMHPLVHCSSDDCGSRVERRARPQVLWPVDAVVRRAGEEELLIDSVRSELWGAVRGCGEGD